MSEWKAPDTLKLDANAQAFFVAIREQVEELPDMKGRAVSNITAEEILLSALAFMFDHAFTDPEEAAVWFADTRLKPPTVRTFQG